MRVGELFACGTSGLGQMNLGGVLCASALLQAGLVEYRRQNPTTYHAVNKLLMATTVINGLGTLWAIGKTVNGLKKHFDISLFSERIRTGQWVSPDWTYGKIFCVNSSILSSLIVTFGTTTVANMILCKRDNPTTFREDALRQLLVVPQVIMTIFSSLTFLSSSAVADMALCRFSKNEATVREDALRQSVIVLMITMLPHVRSLQNCATLLGLGSALVSSVITPFVKQSIYQGRHLEVDIELFFYGIEAPHGIEQLQEVAKDEANYNNLFPARPIFDVNANLMPLNGDIRFNSGTQRGRINWTGNHLNSFNYFMLANAVIQLLAAMSFRSGKNLSTALLCTAPISLATTYLQFESGFESIFPIAAISLLILYYRGEGIQQTKNALTFENSLGSKIVLTHQNFSGITVMMQFFLLNEILTSLYGALDSGEKEYYHLILVAMKTAALYGFSQGSWLNISRTYKNPLANCSIDIYKNFSQKLGERCTEIFKNSVEEITLYSKIYIPEGVSLFPTEDAFKTVAESLLHEGENFFDQTFWKFQTSRSNGSTQTINVLFKNTISLDNGLHGVFFENGSKTILRLEQLAT